MQAISVILLLINLNIGISYLVLASVLATEFGERDIESHYFGYMISAYALTAVVCSFSVSWLISKLGRSMVTYIGIFCMCISMILMGIITYVKDKTLMVTFGVF